MERRGSRSSRSSRNSRDTQSQTLGRRAVHAAAALVLASGLGSAGAGLAAEAAHGLPAAPASLAALYPPVAREPVHLFAMLGLQDALSGIVVDVLEGDAAGSRSAFAQFEERYRAAAQLVPEWRDAYPEEPVRTLGAALAGGDRGATMGAVDNLGGVCHRCHLATMAAVQLRFRWGSFAARQLKDPLAGDSVGYGEFKRRLATTFSGIGWDLRQGQVDNARRQFQAFGARFAALQESCLACHATPRRSFVDRDVQQMVEDLGRALEAPAPDPQAIGSLTGRIGQASCSGCHLVHVPAAMAQAQAAASSRAGQ